MTTPYATEAFVHQIIAKALGAGAGDVHLKVGQPPGARVRGDLVFFRVDKIRPEDTEAAALLLAGPERIAQDRVFAYEAPGVGRFRVSAFRQRGALSIVLRSIPRRIFTPAELGLPDAAKALVEGPRGLVVLAGGARSGRSTIAASLVGHVSRSYPRHVVTVEDPIEQVHEDAQGSVAQRAVGEDVASFAHGIRGALRQDPDLVLAADVATPEAMEACLDAAELGPLVVAVVSAADAAQAVSRLLALGRGVPDVADRLAAALRGIVSSRLVPREDGSGEALACDVLDAADARKLVTEAAVRPSR